jgi:undecaprenyl-phosphate 4-deoxy-4-formamido-L-arabinose transferase
MKLSVCIPVYFASSRIVRLVEALLAEFAGQELEIVLVNDGSTDDTESYCLAAAEAHQEVKFISLRRNFGEHNAVICGLNHCTGDWVAIIDDDFQNPPGEIKKLLAAAPSFDVVYSRYPKKQHHWFRNLGSKFNDWVANLMLEKPKGLYLSSFKLVSKPVVEEVIKYKGPFPYIDGLILRVTRNLTSVEVGHSVREEGRSNYTLKKLVALWLNMFINFSIKPMRAMAAVGLFLGLFSFAFGVYLMVEKWLNPSIPIGYTSLIVSLFFLFGLQFVFLGLIGEYLGKQYLDQNGTPQWVIKTKKP